MKRITMAISACAFLIFSIGCASHKYTVIEPSKKELTDYSVLEIRDFKCNLMDDESKEIANGFADVLLKDVIKNRQEHPDKVIFQRVVRETEEIDGVLVLDGTIISYEKGSRALRYFIGFGAGKAYCTIRSVFTDKSTGEKIQELEFNGELSMGFLGGSAEEATRAVVKSYIEYFDDYFQNHITK